MNSTTTAGGFLSPSWDCVLAAVFPTCQVLCTCCGNTSILVIGKKLYTFKYKKKPPTNCKNSNILKMSLDLHLEFGIFMIFLCFSTF